MIERSCTTCKHVKKTFILLRLLGYYGYNCSYGTKPNPVTGEKETQMCDVVRSMVGECGKDGLLWAPKHPDSKD